MGIDASIYSNVQTPQNTFNPVNTVENALKLSTLAMQQQVMGYQLMQQGAMRGAVIRNTDPQTGQLNRAGVLSELGKTMPNAVPQAQSQFNEQDKQAADAKNAQIAAAHATVSMTLPALQYLNGLPSDKAAQAYPGVMAQLKSQGVDTTQAPPSYDPGWLKQSLTVASKSKEGLDNAMLASNIATAPAKLNADLYGSRSPNAELTSQYDKQAQPIRQSQVAMQQMLDNYKNTTPQGDASLILNAYKIKFPDKPDVASLEELSKSQSAPDTWRNMAAKATAGGVDQATRDNLLRDGISTFRANVQSLSGVQQKYQSRQKVQNVNDPSLTSEPAINQTYGAALGLQQQLGPYVPPSGRMMSSLQQLGNKITGMGTASASASTSLPKPGDVENGFVFLGGDPGKPNSWKKAH